jgi:ATP-dependent Clp protease ATP-binding subunit ClpX
MIHPQKSGSAHRDLALYVAALPSLSPQEILEEIRSHGYVGQDRAVRAVSLLAYRHVSRLKKIFLQGVGRDLLPPKTNVLFVGPTGCGKTYLVEILFREVLRLPTVIVDMTGFSETGYVGQDVNTILTRLMQAAANNHWLAGLGVVCLDEFDKLASGQNNAVFAGAGTTKDVSGLGVQRELLKMLEDSEIQVPMDFTPGDYGPRVMMGTRDITFIASGTFSGLKSLMEHTSSEHIGFGRPPLEAGWDRIAVDYREEEVDLVRNFQNYGFLPELIGRFKRVIPFHSLSRDELRSILANVVLVQYRNEFLLDGIELEVQPEVLETIVRRSLRRETGARGIDSAFIQILEDAAFEAYSFPKARRIEVFQEGEGVRYRIS